MKIANILHIEKIPTRGLSRPEVEVIDHFCHGFAANGRIVHKEFHFSQAIAVVPSYDYVVTRLRAT
jgi:endonuclease IV